MLEEGPVTAIGVPLRRAPVPVPEIGLLCITR